ncbi:CFI-box-CTERM domain-containing protein [Schlesneria sp. DSM 10557]|uniref:CFI-box-CTERM domain-containing protein n=1 Tax=Schlesneria sp. DSM 10557 TaxID=3044399 RepID=UPI0035A07628
MPTYRLPAKHFAPLGRVFFTMLRQLSRSEIQEIEVGELLSAVPVIRYRSESDGRLLHARGKLERTQAGTAIFNQPRRPITIQVGFIQENFPPNNADQLILADIAPRIQASHTVRDDTYELVFIEDLSHSPPIKRPYITFPGHPTLTGEHLTRVFFNGDEVHIVLENNTIIGDYTRSLEDEGIKRDFRPKNERTRVVKIGTLLDLNTNKQYRVIEGYFKIAKAKREHIDCDPGDQYCDSERCNVDISYESGEIEVPDGTSEEAAIQEACEAKEREVGDFEWDEVKVVWTREKGSDSGSRNFPKGAGRCVDDAVSIGGTCQCYVVTATYGESQILDVYRSFRDNTLSRSGFGQRFIRWYYCNGPKLASACKSSRLFHLASRIVIYVIYLGLRPFYHRKLK